MSILALRTLRLPPTGTGEHQEAHPRIRSMLTRLLCKQMYSRSWKMMRQIYVMAIGKMTASKNTHPTGRKNQEAVRIACCPGAGQQMEALKRIPKAVDRLSRESCVSLQTESPVHRWHATRAISSGSQNNFRLLSMQRRRCGALCVRRSRSGLKRQFAQARKCYKKGLIHKNRCRRLPGENKQCHLNLSASALSAKVQAICVPMYPTDIPVLANLSPANVKRPNARRSGAGNYKRCLILVHSMIRASKTLIRAYPGSSRRLKLHTSLPRIPTAGCC